MTTQNDINDWVSRAGKNDTHVIIVCDTFSHEDYPVYVKNTENVDVIRAQYNGNNMQRVMEVIELPKFKKKTAPVKLDATLEKAVRNRIMEELKQANDRLEALNCPVLYKVCISSYWSSEGEESSEGTGTTLKAAVEEAETSFSNKNSRLITDIQGSYTTYIVGKNGTSVLIDCSENSVKKYMAKNKKK